ncbi:hypothetical protein DMUE_1552 [Dictyocoela muelleri]|nr:hypothetical protein DMUE_1552 [Dictyocoela muelleri]
MDQPIFGMRFLLENDGIINQPENYINIDGVEYELNFNIEYRNSAEQSIINKTKVYEIKNGCEKNFQLVKKYKTTNPSVGNIKNHEHKTELFKEFNLTRKEYPVPIGMQNDVSDHFDKLIKDRIITET